MKYYFTAEGWLTSEPIISRSTLVVPPPYVPEGFGANWTGTSWVICPYVAPKPTVPAFVTRAQAKLALLQAGLLDNVQAAIDAIPDLNQRKAAQIEWDDRLTFERASGALVTMASLLGMTDSQIDDLFILAASL